MKRLKIDLDELEIALENASWEMSYYLDLETGEILMTTEEARWELESIYEEFYDPENPEAFDITEVVAQSDLPDWRQQMVLEADQIEAGYGSRFISIPQADSHEGYRDMEDFIHTVRDERLQNRLWRAIKGRGAFRYFKDVLLDYPRERERWFKFRDDRTRQRALDWLESVGIEPIIETSDEESG